MSYKLSNEALARELSTRSREPLPEYCRRVLLQLSEEVRGYDFKDAEPDGRIHVSMFEHTLQEVLGFVDWATSIWNQTMRSTHRSRRISTEELVANKPLRDGATPLETLLILFESWYEDPDVGEGPYLSLTRFPCDAFSEDPLATVGNLCAAVGLAALDRLLSLSPTLSKDEAMLALSIVWEFASVAHRSNHMDMAMHFSAEASREKMSRAARARHSKDPRQQVKLQVRELWEKWELSPATYPSAAAFSRDMCDKWPEHLRSEVVVSRWVREWKKTTLSS